MPDIPVPAVAIAHGSISTTPTWTELIDPADGSVLNNRWSFLHIENTTDIRVQISFDGTAVHANIDAGEEREWRPDAEVPIPGIVFVRKTVASSSGDVTADGIV